MNDVDWKNNPYAAPQSVEEAHDGVFRRGKLVYVPRGQDLPDWCLCCGETAAVRRKWRFAVMPIWVRVVLGVWFLLHLTGVLRLVLGKELGMVAFFALLVCALLAMLLREKVVLHGGWCARHAKAKMVSFGLSLLGLVVLVGGLVFGMALSHWGGLRGLMVLGVVLMLAGAIWHGRYVPRVVRLNKEYAVLRGAKQGFLARLDER